jgi:hypothetical protein
MGSALLQPEPSSKAAMKSSCTLDRQPGLLPLRIMFLDLEVS